jgi:hypothetical protein
MANTTFSGPVISKNGFITTGPGITKTINSTGLGAAGLPLTVNAHAGRILISQDADGIYKLPSINTNANGAVAGDTDFNNLNNVGATFMFYIDTLATDVQIITDGVDTFTGAAMIAVDDGAKKAFFPAATNDVLFYEWNNNWWNCRFSNYSYCFRSSSILGTQYFDLRIRNYCYTI